MLLLIILRHLYSHAKCVCKQIWHFQNRNQNTHQSFALTVIHTFYISYRSRLPIVKLCDFLGTVCPWHVFLQSTR